MEIRPLHSWELTPKQAIALQRELRPQVETEDRLGPLHHVAGVDVGLDRSRQRAKAAVAVLSWPQLELVDKGAASEPVSFPYVPGLLSFRETPVVLKALQRLSVDPDLIVCDGHGMAHPRRFGLASHLGLVTDTPTLGVAKSRLIGTHEEVAVERGGRAPLMDGAEVIGMVLRTRSAVKPVYVSIGHRICLATAVRLTLEASPRFRLPETTRWAHRLASESHGQQPRT